MFDVAVSGAVASDLPTQARTLLERMKADPMVDMEADWKVITLWIGGNDLCAACDGACILFIYMCVCVEREKDRVERERERKRESRERERERTTDLLLQLIDSYTSVYLLMCVVS